MDIQEDPNEILATGSAIIVDSTLETEIPSFLEIFKKTSLTGISMALCFNFSIEVFLSVILLQHLSESEDDTAAATLVSTWMNTVCVFFIAPILATAIHLSKSYGAWCEEEENSTLAHVVPGALRDEPREDQPLLHGQENNTETPPGNIQDVNVGAMEVVWEPGDDKERKKERLESSNYNALTIALISAGCATTLTILAKPIFVHALGQRESVAAAAQKFLSVYAYAVPGLMFKLSLEQIIFGFGKVRAAMWFSLIGCATGVGLSFLLGFGAQIGSLKVPRLGPAGVAAGFAVDSYITSILYVLFTQLNKDLKKFNFFKLSFSRYVRNLGELKKILRISGAMLIAFAIELALTLALGVFSGLISTEAQAAMSYCMNFIYLLFIFAAAFGYSCAQEVSRQIGAEKWVAAERIGRYGSITALIYIIPLPTIFAIYPPALEAISGGASEAVSQILSKLVPIMCAGVVFDAYRYNLFQQTRPLNDLIVPNIIALVGVCLGIGLAAGLGFGTEMKIYGLGAGYTTGIAFAMLAMFFRWRYDMNKITQREQSQSNNTSSFWRSCCGLLSQDETRDDTTFTQTLAVAT
ncbi:MAG: hypothetical protein DHS20C10_01450 [marine bacterium B5-7]|nr:MAG: hypothetical protein DHS20C10_01450 [marine bacterium B5-7]